MTTSSESDLVRPPDLPRQRGAADPSRLERARHTDELVQQLGACSEDERPRLVDDLVATNMPVAAAIALRYRWRGIATDDLTQVAYLALTKAARRFDPLAGHAFLSFCVPTITGEVRRHFRDQGWMVRPPRRIQELQQRVLRAQSQLSAALGRAATPAELSTELEEPLSEVLEALEVRGAFAPASLDRPVSEASGSSTLGELLPHEGSFQEAAEARVTLAPAVDRLGPRDRRILQLRFRDGLTQREIATEIGVTQMQVSRLLARIFRDLRNGIGPLDDPATS